MTSFSGRGLESVPGAIATGSYFSHVLLAYPVATVPGTDLVHSGL
jgi:hypothetical protein